MKIIQSGDVFIKLHRKKLPLQIPVYNDKEKIGNFLRYTHHGTFNYRGLNRSNFRECGNDVVKIAREIMDLSDKSVSMRESSFYDRKFTDAVKVKLKNGDFYVSLFPNELIHLHQQLETPIEVRPNFDHVSDSDVFLYHGLPYNIVTSHNHITNIHVYGDEDVNIIDLSDTVVNMEALGLSHLLYPQHTILFKNQVKDEPMLFKFPKIVLSDKIATIDINVYIDDAKTLPDINSFKNLIKNAESSDIYIKFAIDNFLSPNNRLYDDVDYLEEQSLEDLEKYIIPKMSVSNYIDYLLEIYDIIMKHEEKRLNNMCRRKHLLSNSKNYDVMGHYDKQVRHLKWCKKQSVFKRLDKK